MKSKNLVLKDKTCIASHNLVTKQEAAAAALYWRVKQNTIIFIKQHAVCRISRQCAAEGEQAECFHDVASWKPIGLHLEAG